MRNTRAALAVMVGLFGSATGLEAQEQAQESPASMQARMDGHDTAEMIGRCRRMMGMMGMMGGVGMMGENGQRMMSPQPAELLRQREALGLTDEQIERLEALAERTSQNAETHMAEMDRLSAEITGVLAADAPDLDRLETLLRERAEGHVRMQLAQVRWSREARSVLTEQQRHGGNPAPPSHGPLEPNRPRR